MIRGLRRLLSKIIEILDGTPAEYGTRREGQSLVEMTFVVPLLIILVTGMVEIGWFAQNYLNMMESARVGARRGPFLTGENGPIMWVEGDDLNDARSLAPHANLGWDGDEDNPRFTSRGLGPDGCLAIPEQELGFYNIIACVVREALEPMQIRPNGQDDIVISAFSVQRVRVGNPAVPGNDINPAEFGSQTDYDPGSQVVVVGRWPFVANECAFDGAPAFVRERDPFDWIENGQVDWALVPNPLGGPDVRMIYEMGYYDDALDQVVGYADNRVERQRGWMLMGQREIEDRNRNRSGCYGSSWSSRDVENLLNMRGFIETDEEARYLPTQGLVLVEIFWRHELLLPLFNGRLSPVANVLGSNDPNSTIPVIYAWAVFPAPGAEPRLTFRPPGAP